MDTKRPYKNYSDNFAMPKPAAETWDTDNLGHPPLSDLPYKPTPQMLAAKPQPTNHTVGMTQARKHIVSIDRAGTYHCVSRCVRRSWLCSWDSYLQKSFEHRKPWVERKIIELAEVLPAPYCRTRS